MSCLFVRYAVSSVQCTLARYSIKRHARYIRASLQFFRTNDEGNPGEKEKVWQFAR